MTKVQKKQTGRPPLEEGEETVRVGFALPRPLWEWAVKQAEKRGISYSMYIRELVEKAKAGK